MQTGNEKQSTEARPPDFVAELTPYRSLGKNGFLILMAVISVTCFSAGIMFLAVGAWPVVFFLGLDVLIIWLAFKINYHSAKAKEYVYVGRDQLKICKVDAWGRSEEHVFNPFWTRFEIDRHDELGITQMSVLSKGKRLAVGAFLNPVDRESFATAFSNALAKAKAA